MLLGVEGADARSVVGGLLETRLERFVEALGDVVLVLVDPPLVLTLLVVALHGVVP